MNILKWIVRLVFWVVFLTWELITGESMAEEVPYGDGIVSDERYRKNLLKTIIFGWTCVLLFFVIWFLPELKNLFVYLLWVLGFIYLLMGFLHGIFNSDDK